MTNLPRYKCYCEGRYFCDLCHGNLWIDYFKAAKTREGLMTLGEQMPQCHICTKFETESNPLFAYSYHYEIDGKFRLIYRCRNGHSFDHGMSYRDIETNLIMHC